MKDKESETDKLVRDTIQGFKWGLIICFVGFPVLGLVAWLVGC